MHDAPCQLSHRLRSRHRAARRRRARTARNAARAGSAPSRSAGRPGKQRVVVAPELISSREFYPVDNDCLDVIANWEKKLEKVFALMSRPLGHPDRPCRHHVNVLERVTGRPGFWLRAGFLSTVYRGWVLAPCLPCAYPDQRSSSACANKLLV
jgi:hypothetical protein